MIDRRELLKTGSSMSISSMVAGSVNMSYAETAYGDEYGETDDDDCAYGESYGDCYG